MQLWRLCHLGFFFLCFLEYDKYQFSLVTAWFWTALQQQCFTPNPNQSTYCMGRYYTHFVHSISNSTTNHFHIDLINALFLYWLFDDKIAPHSTSNIIRCWILPIFIIKQSIPKNKCIDWVYIKVINRTIQDWMDKMSMNQPLL